MYIKILFLVQICCYFSWVLPVLPYLLYMRDVGVESTMLQRYFEAKTKFERTHTVHICY